MTNEEFLLVDLELSCTCDSGQVESVLQLILMVERSLPGVWWNDFRLTGPSRSAVQECCICTIVVGSDEVTKRRADKLKQAGLAVGNPMVFRRRGMQERQVAVETCPKFVWVN